MSVHVFAGETFAALWDGDDEVIEQRRRDRESGGDYSSYLDYGGTLERLAWERAGCPERDEVRRADGELVGQLRLPDELLPVARGEMFP